MLYVGIVVCLRASGVLVTDHSIKPIHKREVALVLVAMIAGFMITATAAVQVVAASTETPEGEPDQPGLQRLRRAVRASR